VAGLPGHGADGSEAIEALGGAETVELDAHPVYDPEVHATELATFALARP
jgi:hypothetical protein